VEGFAGQGALGKIHFLKLCFRPNFRRLKTDPLHIDPSTGFLANYGISVPASGLQPLVLIDPTGHYNPVTALINAK
jgi:hypothetical protein